MSGEPIEIEHRRDHPFKKKPGKTKGCALCNAAKVDMRHVGAAQSLNVHGSSANQFVYQAMKQRWQERLTELLLEAGLPKGLERVLVEGEMCFPDRARRDQGNFRFLVEKALGDTLVAGGWLEDDDWSRYEFGGLAYAYEAKVSYTRLLVFPTFPR